MKKHIVIIESSENPSVTTPEVVTVFANDGMARSDILDAIHAAGSEFLLTEEGKALQEQNRSGFTYRDFFCHAPRLLMAKYGFTCYIPEDEVIAVKGSLTEPAESEQDIFLDWMCSLSRVQVENFLEGSLSGTEDSGLENMAAVLREKISRTSMNSLYRFGVGNGFLSYAENRGHKKAAADFMADPESFFAGMRA